MGALSSLDCCITEDRSDKYNRKACDNTYNTFDFESHLRTENDPIEESLHSHIEINSTNIRNPQKITEYKVAPTDALKHVKNEHQYDVNNINKTETLSRTTGNIQSETVETIDGSKIDDEQTVNIQSQTVEQKECEELKINSLNIISENKNLSSGFRIQVEQLASFDGSNPWVLRKNRDQESPASTKSQLKAFSYDKKMMKQKRVTLTSAHNFLWFTSILQGSVKYAKQESEITKASLNKILNLLPIPFRDKIWDICNLDDDTFIVYEDFNEFVDALLVATGQSDINIILNDQDEMFEIRDMSGVFHQVIDLKEIFIKKKNISNTVSRSKPTLSTLGAKKLIILIRNLDSENEINPNDISIPILTGFTKKAVKHSVKYCSRIFWKILTDVWWDEDDEADIALPYHLDTTIRRHSRKRSKVSDDVRRHLSNTSMSDLFPHLYTNKSYDTDDDDENDDNIKGNFLGIY